MKKHIKLIILIIIAVLALAILGLTYFQLVQENKSFDWGSFSFVHKNNSDIDTSDWLTYTNEEYGFEFKYPKEWNIYYQTFKNGVYSIEFSYNKFNYDEPLMNNVVLVGVSIHPNKETLHKISNQDEIIKKYNFLGHEATWFQYSDDNVVGEKIQSLYIKLNTNIFISVSGLKINFDKIVSTLSFIN